MLDKYYTKINTIQKIIRNVNFDGYDVVIEPSAGNGAFLSFLPADVIAIDIAPENDNIIKMNWLDYNTDKNNILVIGNPPFGKQGSMALKFIKKCNDIKADFAFILPRSFKKVSLKNKIPINYHLQFEMELDKDSFLYNNISYDVPSVFQIWHRKEYPRILYEIKKSSKFFTFVKKEIADFSIRRVGFYAGKIDYDLNKSKSSHYFIKSLIDKELFFNEVKNTIFESNNTTGPKSISKNELIQTIDNKLKIIDKIFKKIYN